MSVTVTVSVIKSVLVINDWSSSSLPSFGDGERCAGFCSGVWLFVSE